MTRLLAATLVLATALAIAWTLREESPTAPPTDDVVLRRGDVEPDDAVPPNALDRDAAGQGAAAAADAAHQRREAEPDGWSSLEVTGRIGSREDSTHDAVGAPGLDVTLTARATSEPDAAVIRRFELTTDEDGRFEVEFDPPEHSLFFRLEVAPDPNWSCSARGMFVAPLGSPALEIDVGALPLDAILEGTVRDVRGRPIPGAVVKAMSERSEAAADGSYRIAVPSRAYGRVEAWSEDHGLVEEFIDGVEAGGTARLDFVLPDALTLRGVVTDSRGAPVGNARVRANSRRIWTVRTDAAGRYTIGSLVETPRGTWSVKASGAGFAATSKVVELEDGRRAYECDFQLDDGIPLDGRVVDADGRAIAAAHVWASWSGADDSEFTDDDGAYSIDGLREGPLRIGAEADGWAPLETEIQHRRGVPVELTMQRPMAVRGFVRSADGEPIPDVHLAAQRDGRYLEVYAKTDASGAFELRGLPPSTGLGLEAYASGWMRTEQALPIDALAPADALDESDPVALSMSPAGVLRGRVVDALGGAPIESFTVRLGWPQWSDGRPDGAEPIRGITSTWVDTGRTFHDEEGQWRTGDNDELPPGAWAMVEITAPGYAPHRVDAVQVSAATDDPPREYALERPVTLQVDVRRGEEPVPAGIRIRVTLVGKPGDDDAAWEATTGALGSARVEGIPPGPVHVEVQRDLCPPHFAGPFTVDRGSNTVRVDLPEGEPLDVVLLRSSGAPWPGEDVLLTRTSGYQNPRDVPLRARTGDDGTVRFRSVPAGRWQLARGVGRGRFPGSDLVRNVVLAEGAEREPVVLQPSGDTDVVISFTGDLVPPDGTIVRIESDGRPARCAKIADRRATLEGVEAGTSRLHTHWWVRSVGDSAVVDQMIDVPDGGSFAAEVEAAIQERTPR